MLATLLVEDVIGLHVDGFSCLSGLAIFLAVSPSSSVLWSLSADSIPKAAVGGAGALVLYDHVAVDRVGVRAISLTATVLVEPLDVHIRLALFAGLEVCFAVLLIHTLSCLDSVISNIVAAVVIVLRVK